MRILLRKYLLTLPTSKQNSTFHASPLD